MQTGRSYSPDELIVMNSAAEVAKQEMLSTVVEENVRRFSEVKDTQEETTEEILSSIRDVETAIQEKLNRQDDFNHKDNVRVYRNVQAAVKSDLDAQSALLKQEIALLKEELVQAREENRKLLAEKKLRSPLLVWTFLFAAAILCIEVLDFTGALDYLIRIGNAFFFGM
ncbi:MAG: hypothetical protein J5935_06880 [Lachnospiraceae bacterium]|nr:hypothetical protein [Lachnospiraceae bacterium]